MYILYIITASKFEMYRAVRIKETQGTKRYISHLTVQHSTRGWVLCSQIYLRHIYLLSTCQICTLAEVDQGHSGTESQALFSATGFSGVSEPEDIDEVDDGDILEEFVVKPNGNTGGPLALDEGAALFLFNKLLPVLCCADINPAPKVREYVSRSDTSGEQPLALAAKCCAAAGP